MPTTKLVTDPAFTKSPYNWAGVVVGGSTDAIRAANSGAFIDFSFTGTSCVLNIDTSSFGVGQSCSIYYFVDGTPASAPVLSGNTTVSLATGLSDTTHALKLYLNYGVTGDGNLWPGEASLTITGVTLDTGKTIIASAENSGSCALMFGDSTMMGYTGSTVIAYASFGTVLCGLINMRAGMCAFSGQRWNETVFGGLPGLVDAWDFIYSGKARTFTPDPALVINNMGFNGTVIAATVEDWLADVRATLPTVRIVQVMPFNQSPGDVAANILEIKEGYADYMAAHPSDGRLMIVDLGASGQTVINNGTYSSDGTHPNEAGCALLAQMVAAVLNTAMAAPPGNPAFADAAAMCL